MQAVQERHWILTCASPQEFVKVSNAGAPGLFLAPHTSGPRDVPRCGALSLLQKPLHYRGDPAETAATLYVKLCVLVVVVVVVPGRGLSNIQPNPLFESI